MKEPARTVAIDTSPESAFRHRERDAVACIDVMLATTTLVTAVARGRRAFVAAGAPDLRALQTRLGEALVVGSPDGGPGDFEVPDGPCAVGRIGGDQRPIVLLSPPGTELIANAAEGGAVMLACFRNLSATAAALARHRQVALLAAGCREEFSCEDQMAAAWIAERLLQRGFETEDRRTADLVRRWTGIAPSLAGWGNSAALLRREGRSEEVDFVIGHVDDLALVCLFEANDVRLELEDRRAEVGVRGASPERSGE